MKTTNVYARPIQAQTNVTQIFIVKKSFSEQDYKLIYILIVELCIGLTALSFLD